MSYFAERFQEWCHDKGLTSDYQLAQLGHLNRDTISKIKNNPVLNPLDAEPGDKFDVRLVLGNGSVTEIFVV